MTAPASLSENAATNKLKDYFRSPYRTFKAHVLEQSQWRARKYAAPSPRLVKNEVLVRNGIPNATWIETGTFMGETTAFLAKSAKAVISLEPAEMFFKRAEARFRGNDKIRIVNGPSETVFPELLPTLRGPVNFWLDGHFSDGMTFSGEVDTPIVAELKEITKNLATLGQIRVLVDDVRCFLDDDPANKDYPSIDYLVDWARENNFSWHIEHDIFVARPK